MTEVIPNLWIGNWREASHSKGMRVITVAHDAPFTGQEKFNLVDGPGNDPTVFEAAVAAVVQSVRQGPTGVHCVSGRSRSAAVTLAAICQLQGLNYCQAYDFLISRYTLTRIHPALASLILCSTNPH